MQESEGEAETVPTQVDAADVGEHGIDVVEVAFGHGVSAIGARRLSFVDSFSALERQPQRPMAAWGPVIVSNPASNCARSLGLLRRHEALQLFVPVLDQYHL